MDAPFVRCLGRSCLIQIDHCDLDELGLETKEIFVLAEVATSPYPAEIAAALMLPKASVTVYVRNLVAKGFLRREIDDADLRRRRLILTAEGEKARDRALCWQRFPNVSGLSTCCSSTPGSSTPRRLPT